MDDGHQVNTGSAKIDRSDPQVPPPTKARERSPVRSKSYLCRLRLCHRGLLDNLGSSQLDTAADCGQTQPPSSLTIAGPTMDICIIGGGASGLSALQVIMGTPQYSSGLWKATLFEARDKTGGIW